MNVMDLLKHHFWFTILLIYIWILFSSWTYLLTTNAIYISDLESVMLQDVFSRHSWKSWFIYLWALHYDVLLRAWDLYITSSLRAHALRIYDILWAYFRKFVGNSTKNKFIFMQKLKSMHLFIIHAFPWIFEASQRYCLQFLHHTCLFTLLSMNYLKCPFILISLFPFSSWF